MERVWMDADTSDHNLVSCVASVLGFGAFLVL